ncbi:MAG: hypothetical protein ACLGI3_20615 [Actinomycetes bacterium]
MTSPEPSAWRRWMVSGALATVSIVGVSSAHAAQPAPEEEGPFFGAGNVPAVCEADMTETLEDGSDNPAYWLREDSQAVCHHMRTDMNGLDSPQIDVLILVPVSPAAERDMRIMRQSIEMWEGGIDHLADKLDLDWLAEGVDFHVTVDVVDPAGEGGEFTTYPVVDPEIVVVATNPVGGLGIGIDPVDFSNDVFGEPNEGQGPCHGIANPFDMEAWEALPGFDSHHEAREGVYEEDCGGAGGNVCFAVNGAIDPTPGEGALEDFFSLFDLVSHEVGHCLSIGHVGDGAEGDWGGLASNDIMAYSADPPGISKCVSSLDVEGFATRMSRYLDVDGDGAVTEADALEANDQVGDGRSPFQVQRPEDHVYASSTGEPADCPQPDLGLVPGEQPDWTPEEAPASSGRGQGKRKG